MRYAIYFTPPADAPLTRAAVAWLGRDAFTNASSERPPNCFLVFALTEGGKPIRLPEALALVTSRPADAVRLEDRGRIAPGMRADLVRVRALDGAPHVRSVWREGRRVA